MKPTKTTTTEETRKYNPHGKDQEAKFHLEQAGEALKKPGMIYMGSVACHAYTSITGDRIDFTTMSQIEHIPEQAGIEMTKAVVKAIMTSYGHDPDKGRRRK